MRLLRTLLCLLFACAEITAQNDRTAPPSLQASAGGFTIRRRAGPGVIGDLWRKIEPTFSGTVRAPNGAFTFSLTNPNEAGDVGRSQLRFTPRTGPSMPLAPDVVAFSYITNDSRWIFFEPVDAIDVRGMPPKLIAETLEA